MKLCYKNKKTQELCEDYHKAIKHFGKDVALKLMGLINAMKSFPTLFDLKGFPQYRLHALIGNHSGEYSFTIDKRYKWRLLVYPLDENGVPLSDRSNETALLMKSVAVEIMEVSEHYA